MTLAYLGWVQLILLIGSVGVMCGAIALFLANRDRIMTYAPEGFRGNHLFWSYLALLLFFICGYVGYLVLCIAGGMQGVDLLITLILFFGAWFVVITMVFIRRLFDSILFEQKNQVDALTYDRMFSCADQAMYHSKQNGKNQATIWNPQFGAGNV